MSPPLEWLLVFARYPLPGHTKTRLIPALGPEGAARCSAALTLRALTQAEQYRQRFPCQIQVHYSGGNTERMKQLFGPHFDYCPQQGSDLGQRLQAAVATAFSAGASRVLIIGTDCPDLDADLLQHASEALTEADLVLGPAYDGGYYMMGMRAYRPEVFQNIDWGTSRVLQQTMEAAGRLGWSVQQLQPLSDVDEPEDLIVCRRLAAVLPDCLPEVRAGITSIIIPTLNEEQRLTQTLQSVCGESSCEVIVADGGSSDATLSIAESFGARVVQSQPGRGRQMNAGAAVATGETLLFLHGDSQLPENFVDSIQQTLSRENCCAGAFRLKIDDPARAFKLLAWGANQRARWLQLPYGDQGLFLPSRRFFALGGYGNLPLMEDVELCQRLQQRGRIELADDYVVTSARRWKKLGVARTTLVNQMCLTGYLLGISPERLAGWYRRQPRKVC